MSEFLADGSAHTPPVALAAREVSVGYAERMVPDKLDLVIPTSQFTAIIGPNACGKSTLLRALARVLTPKSGSIVLDGRDISQYRAKEVARRMGLLPQTAQAPDGIMVADLVARGRHPYRMLLRSWSTSDEAAVASALAMTRTTDLAGRLVDELSGGQRQRVWLAMLLAQDVPTMLLDEPTTFLDIAHQFELLELLHGLGKKGRTLAVVLHDLNQAARYADHVVVMKQGKIVAAGTPATVINAEVVADVFDLPAVVIPDPVTATPMVVPLPRVTAAE